MIIIPDLEKKGSLISETEEISDEELLLDAEKEQKHSLLPDLGELDKKEQLPTLIEFSYDNTLEEIDGAMKSFQSKFKNKRGIISIVAYSCLTCAVITTIIFNLADPSSSVSFLSIVALIFCVFGIIYNITDGKRTRTKTLDALKDMNPEEYKASFFEDRIELETIVKPKENEVEVKIDEEADEKIISPLKSIFTFSTDTLDFIENNESLMLIFAKRQIYCFPKRCLSSGQEEKIREFLTEKLYQN